MDDLKLGSAGGYGRCARPGKARCAALLLCGFVLLMPGLAGADQGRVGARAVPSPDRSAANHAPSGTSASGPIERFALAIGANEGGAERVLLRYAHADAEAFLSVMQQLGGLSKSRALILRGPTAAEVRTTFEKLAGQMQAAVRQGKRVQFVFYYSGHSDGLGLRLRQELLPYRELRAEIAGLPAAVKIAVLDSCSSGVFTRSKGGKHVAPFLVDLSNEVRGHAFLTSSAASEAAQESDALAGSFFTHYLVSGLRGAADVDGNGRVTLNEAYRFAFDETLARTVATQAGPQHPAYDFQLAGTGDVVMTELAQATARMVLPAGLTGRVFVRSAASGRLLLELGKTRGRQVTMAVPKGAYHVSVERPLEVLQGRVALVEGQSLPLDDSVLSPVPREVTASRGPTEPAAGQTGSPVHVSSCAGAGAYQLEIFGATLWPSVDTASDPVADRVCTSLWLVGLFGERYMLDGVQVALGVPRVLQGVRGLQLAFVGNRNDRDLRGVQWSTGFNWTGGDGLGVQVAGLYNVVEDRQRGIQLAGIVNYAGLLQGAQGALVNVVAGAGQGAQVGAINRAQGFTGVQIGALNIAHGELSGVQLGGMNVAAGRVAGMQLGLFNYADDADAQVGVLSYSRKHGAALQTFVSDLGWYNLALRFNELLADPKGPATMR